MTPRLAIVLAVKGGAGRLPEVLEALHPQCDESIEVFVCHSEDDGRVRELCRNEPWVTAVEGAAASLVPHLWRDGILRAEAPRVALSVVHCRPERDWVEALLAADLERFVAVGGAIDNDPVSDALGWAVYLLRYLRYARPFVARETHDLAGDNAVYDHAALRAHASAFADGFWEPVIHARLMREGHRLRLDPSIAMVHANGYGFREFASMRFEHGRRFGRDRAAAMPRPQRLLYLVASPAAFLVLGAKILRGTLGRPAFRGHLVPALPALSAFLIAWGSGEAMGVLDAVRRGAK